MFYRPRREDTGRMWDTWLFFHEGTYYLYYLANRSDCPWDNISMATSTDGVHWRELGPVLRKPRHVTWMGTGSTWMSPAFARDRTFLMSYSWEIGPRQTIWFAQSADLVHWTALGPAHEFVQEERWYERTGRWDCIWTIPRPEGGLYGYWTATPKERTGGRFGFGKTQDGANWQALPPPRVEGAQAGEVGAVAHLGGRLVIDAKGRAELGSIKLDGTAFQAEKAVDREMDFGRTASLRLCLQRSLLEVYLDDILIECFSLPHRCSGRVGAIHGDSTAGVRDLTVWSCAAR